jgi:hypothetical protein
MSKRTGTGITPDTDAKVAADGKARGAYNKAHGRKANAPLSGGSRAAAHDALLSKKTKGDPYRDRSAASR